MGYYLSTYPAKWRKCLSIFPVNLPPSSASKTHLALPILFQLPEGEVSGTAIIDSGACSCFIDLTFATQQLIPLQPKVQGLSIHLADGSCMKSGLVTQETLPLPVITTTKHKEILSLGAISPPPLFPVILGLPWLQAHNPQIDWFTGRIIFQSTYCRKHCLPEPSVASSTLLCMDSDYGIRRNCA